MKPDDLDRCNLTFYRQLREDCPYKDCCRKSAGITGKDEVFIPLPPKVVGTIPRIIVLAMEPSGDWAKNNKEAKKQIKEGKRCFWNHLGNLTLHYSIQEALVCWHDESCRFDYYITNLGKCAMKVKNAETGREERWGACLGNVKKELRHVLSLRDNDRVQPIVFTMGKEPYEWLRRMHRKDESSLRVTLPHKHPVVSLFPEGGHLLHNAAIRNFETYWNKLRGRPEDLDKRLVTEKVNLAHFVQGAYTADPTGLEKAIHSINSANSAKLDIYAIYAKLAMVYHEQLADGLRVR